MWPRARACVAQNYGQGLGFVLARTVIDKRSLKAAMFKLIGAVSIVIAYLLTLSEDAEEIFQCRMPASSTTAPGGVVCNLTAVQKTTIQSLLAERNASCSYNMTVASLLLEG